MIKYILMYGGLCGLITIGSMLTGLVLSGGEGLGSSMMVGFLIMFIAMTLIFFGIRKYRDQERGGVITFGHAFRLGLGMAAMAGVMYVAVWELYLAITDSPFVHDYTAEYIAKKEAAGVSGEELEEIKAKMAKLVDDYANPFKRMAITFSEIFPLGLIYALVSAFLLRFPKGKPDTAGAV